MGCPIRRSQDQSLITDSPGLIAGLRVLHRLSTPRHPPCALLDHTNLTPGAFAPNFKLMSPDPRPARSKRFGSKGSIPASDSQPIGKLSISAETACHSALQVSSSLTFSLRARTRELSLDVAVFELRPRVPRFYAFNAWCLDHGSFPARHRFLGARPARTPSSSTFVLSGFQRTSERRSAVAPVIRSRVQLVQSPEGSGTCCRLPEWGR